MKLRTSGLELFSVKASEAEQDAKAIEDNHRNPTPEGDKRAEMLRVPKPDFHEFKQGYRFDPAKIDWENLKKIGITADTLKNTKDFDRVMRGYKSRNTYTVSGTVGGFYLKPTDVKLSFYQAKDGTVVPKLHGVQQDEKLLQRPFHEHGFTKQEQGNLQGTGNLGGIAEIKDPKSGEQIPVFVSRDRYTHELEYMRADKWKCPDKVQPKDVTPAAESRTQVAVNSEGKTNEATKQGKEPLKQGQDKPTAKQKEKQDKTLKADKPKKSKGMKM